ELARVRHDPWISRIDAVDVGVDIAAVSFDAGGDGDGGGVRTAAAERSQPAVAGDAVEAGDDGDGAACHGLAEGGGLNRLDARVAMNAGRSNQLPAHEAARLHAHVLK